MFFGRMSRISWVSMRLGALMSLVLFAVAGGIVTALLVNLISFPGTRISRDEVSLALSRAGDQAGFPEEVTLELAGSDVQARVDYSFDPALQRFVEDLFARANPDFGAFAAVNPSTGEILALVSHQARRLDPLSPDATQSIENHLALRATFPAASIFKVVTAAAAIAEREFSADTKISFNGANHTLFKGQVLKSVSNRWTRHMSLKQAFAQSVNTVFGKLGAFTVGAAGLRDYAERFGFNRVIASDLPIQPGRALIPSDADRWTLAEAASGFTRDNTMSPLQGALIAATIVNDGVMAVPFGIRSVRLPEGEPLYVARPDSGVEVIPPKTAEELRELMRATVSSGTSRKSFRGFSRGSGAKIEVGGKTGSLSGNSPKGRYDWFVGYGIRGDRKIALAALTIHQELWRIKSSLVARKAIESFFLGGDRP